MDAVPVMLLAGFFIFILIQDYKTTKRIDIKLDEKTNQSLTVAVIIYLILIEFYLFIQFLTFKEIL